MQSSSLRSRKYVREVEVRKVRNPQRNGFSAITKTNNSPDGHASQPDETDCRTDNNDGLRATPALGNVELKSKQVSVLAN